MFIDKAFLIEKITDMFNKFNRSVASAAEKIIISPEKYSPSAAATINDISEALIGTAIVLVALFFLVDLCNKSIMFEIQNYETIAKLFLRFLLAKGVVDNTHIIMDWIFNGFASVLNIIGNVGDLSLGGETSQAIIDSINNMDAGTMGFNYLLYYMSMLPSMLIVDAASVIASVIVIGRMFEIFVYTTIAPLPLATLAGETSNDTAKRFLMNYIAVCLQGVIIIVVFKIFGGIMSDSFAGDQDFYNYLLLVVVFVLTLFKSGTWAKQIVGVA